MKRRIFLLFSFVMMALGLGAQSLVFHYCGGGEAVVPLPASWNFSDGKLVVSGGGEIVEININNRKSGPPTFTTQPLFLDSLFVRFEYFAYEINSL